jgi:alanine racemase
MDLMAVDITDLDKNAVRRGHMVTLIGEGISVDELAHHFGTIGYEVLTSLGRRFARVYTGGEARVEPPTLATAEAPMAAAEPTSGAATPPPVPSQAAAMPPPVPSEAASTDKA